MEDVVEPLSKFELRVFCKHQKQFDRKSMSLLVLYYCDIFEFKDTSRVRYSVAAMRYCVRSRETEGNIFTANMADERSVKETKMVKSRFLESTRKNAKSV